MPRPGPRPYECVRRAWHSDRHQPMRGLLIQEIFRVVNEIHSTATKKNKEWQEKLPIVVLRAEEIMYSKANSEAEYMDLKTLLDRTNDAINTIIRLDETTETGEFLQPCIEAALHLGCTPRRASRSQRSINPRCYLSQEPNSLEAVPTRNHNIFMKPPPSRLLRSPTNPVLQTNNSGPKNFPFRFENDVLRTSEYHHRLEKCPASKYLNTYPLCYSYRISSLPISNTGSSDSSKSNPLFKNINKLGIGGMHNETIIGDCDLSLRLGLFEDIDSPTRKRSKVSNPKPQQHDNGLNCLANSFSNQFVTKDEFLKLNATTTTKTAGKNGSFAQAMDDRRLSWRLGLSFGEL